MVLLYFSFLTIFSPYFLEDMIRMHERKGDCFGLCCCKEDSKLCCGGRFLNTRNKKFSKLIEEDRVIDEEN